MRSIALLSVLAVLVTCATGSIVPTAAPTPPPTDNPTANSIAHIFANSIASCTCSNGVAATGSACTYDAGSSTEVCSECNANYYLAADSSCVTMPTQLEASTACTAATAATTSASRSTQCTIVRAASIDNSVDCETCGTFKKCPPASLNGDLSSEWDAGAMTGQGSDTSSWIKACTVKEADGTRGENRLIISWGTGATNSRIASFQTGANLNLGSGGRGEVTEDGVQKKLWWTWMSSERKFTTFLEGTTCANPSGPGGECAGYGKVKMLRMSVCREDLPSETCAEKKIQLSCRQATCDTTLDDYGCSDSSGNVRGHESDGLNWDTEDNCSDDTKHFAFLLG